MAKKKLGKSQREGMLNTFIEARCSCGNCRCTWCGGCSTSVDGQARLDGGQYNTSSILTGYFNTLGAM
ncbi:hypothetical protein [Neglectibacter sp. X4]|uniref:hypothetical protein n=1 Tax=Neglectibacter sp. X4 TaxID=2305472 RepID=UPI00136E52E3|nr:hypothetical protein [Neglectibacter sp. X4]